MPHRDDALHAGITEDWERIQKDFRVLQSQMKSIDHVNALRLLLLIPGIHAPVAAEAVRAGKCHHRFAAFDSVSMFDEQFKDARASAMFAIELLPLAAGF